MRGTILLFSPILLGLGVGCASEVRVHFDERADFSRYHTWAWLPDSASRVDAPHANSPALTTRLARLIEEQLGKRGYDRTAEHADFFVSYQLVLRRHEMAIEVPRAPYLFSSYNSSASYWIEGSETQYRVYEDLQLLVRIIEANGRITWQAAVERRSEGGFDRNLEDLVTALLERLPAHRGSKPQQRTPPPRGESSDRVARRAGSGPVNLCAWVIGLPPGFFYGDRNTGAASL